MHCTGVNAADVRTARFRVYSGAWERVMGHANDLTCIMSPLKQELDQHVAYQVLEARKAMLHSTMLKGAAGRAVTIKQHQTLAQGLKSDLARVQVCKCV